MLISDITVGVTLQSSGAVRCKNRCGPKASLSSEAPLCSVTARTLGIVPKIADRIRDQPDNLRLQTRPNSPPTASHDASPINVPQHVAVLQVLDAIEDDDPLHQLHHRLSRRAQPPAGPPCLHSWQLSQQSGRYPHEEACWSWSVVWPWKNVWKRSQGSEAAWQSEPVVSGWTDAVDCEAWQKGVYQFVSSHQNQWDSGRWSIGSAHSLDFYMLTI